MSLVRLLPASLHAVADYAVGALLVIVAIAVGGSAGAVATGIVVGATVLVVSMLTKYPLGVVKVLPFTVHSAGDYLAAALLLIAPFTLNFADGDGGWSHPRYLRQHPQLRRAVPSYDARTVHSSGPVPNGLQRRGNRRASPGDEELPRVAVVQQRDHDHTVSRELPPRGRPEYARRRRTICLRRRRNRDRPGNRKC